MAFKVIDNVEEYLSSRNSKYDNKYQPQQNIYDPFMESQETIEKTPYGVKFEEKEVSEPESYLGKAARVGLGALASGVSGLAGVPRSFIDTANSLGNIFNPEIPEEFREKFKDNPELEKMLTSENKVLPTGLTPSSKQVKQAIGKALPEGYLNPQGEEEESIQEFANDIGSLLFPIGGSTKLVKAAKIAGFPNAAKFLTRKLGGSEEWQEGVKLGTTLLGAFGLQDSLKKRASDMYNKVEEIVPDNFKISSNPVRQLISKIEKFSLRGDTGVESKKAVNDVLKNLKSISKGEEIGLKNLIAFKQDTNERLVNAFKNHPRASKQLKDISQGLNSILKDYIEVPKEVSSLLLNADNIYQEVKEAEKVHNFLSKNAESISKIPIVGSLLAPLKIVKNAVGGALEPLTGPVTQGTKNIFDFFRNFSNPSVRNEYAKMMGGAIKDNRSLFLKHAHKLNAALDREKPIEYESIGSKFKVIDNVDEYLNRKARSKRN